MASPPHRRSLKRVTPPIIRHLFNGSQYIEDIRNGVLLPSYVRNVHLPKPEKVNEPWCTHSQYIRYVDNKGKWCVEVHQYLRPDNTIGGSGRQDPKRLRLRGQIYISDQRRKL